MATIDEITSEVIVAKEQLKQINATINADRKVVKDLEIEIEEKKKNIKELEKEIGEKKEEITSLDSTKKWIEKEYGKARDNIKAEINKLAENKKKDEKKYQVVLDELNNDVKVLKDRKKNLENEIENLKWDVKDLEDGKRWVIVELDGKIEEKREELNNLNLLFDAQDESYNRVAIEIEDMNKKLEEKDELIADCEKLERSITEKTEKLVEIRDEIIGYENKMIELRDEIKDLEDRKMIEANEVADYVKKKMELKDRKDQLDLKEKYLRKRFEEAWINFD